MEAGRMAARGSFEAVYRANVAALSAYFARRCSEPQTVADLTSETFLEAIESFRSFDARRGSPRAWLFGIAHHLYARHCATVADGRYAAVRLAAQLTLDDDETEQLAAKIDDQRAGRRLLERCARLPETDRAAIELVDLSGLSIAEAAVAPHTSSGALRVRLFWARARLRNGAR
jgi:RNA polymerase sigma-70 factor (ECF subfamily)